MRTSFQAVTAVVSLGLAAGCTSNSSTTPTYLLNLSTTRLQIAVGTATFPGGTVDLNVVTTFRQPSGVSATLWNTPLVTGPAGFVVPAAADAGTDAGTDHISGSPKTSATPAATTFGETGGAFAYGFAPDNTTNLAAPNFVPYGGNGEGAPFYGSQLQTFPYTAGWPFVNSAHTTDYVPFLGGPPLFPYTQNGTYPAGFYGFAEGFTTFAVTPVAGTYDMSVTVPPSNNTGGGTVKAPATTLTSVAGLPAYPAPAFVEDGKGGGTVSVVAPAGVTETLVNIVDLTVPAFYTLEILGSGAGSAKLPDDLGPALPGSSAPSLTPPDPSVNGDTYIVTAIGFDYPAFEAAGPDNIDLQPTIAGANGQADLTISPVLVQAYGGSTIVDLKKR